jgi:hypothetical protein
MGIASRPTTTDPQYQLPSFPAIHPYWVPEKWPGLDNIVAGATDECFSLDASSLIKRVQMGFSDQSVTQSGTQSLSNISSCGVRDSNMSVPRYTQYA